MKDISQNNRCKNCGAEAKNFSDISNGWLCDDCYNVEVELDQFANKMEKKLSKRVYSFNIDELISCLSKDEIYNIARNLGINKVSGLNKDKLIEKFLLEYEELIEKRFLLFEEERYKILKGYIDNKGVKLFDDIDEDEVDKSSYFIQQGIIFPTVKDGVSMFLMPKVIQDLIKDKNNIDYRRIIKNNTEIINIFRGMNKAYGVLTIESIKEILKRYVEYDVNNIEQLILESAYYYNEYREENSLIVNNEIGDYERLQNNIQNDLEYSVIPKDELLSMSEAHWIHNCRAGKAFFKAFTEMFSVDKDMLITMMEELALDVQENDPKDAVDGIIDLINIENEEAKYFAAAMMNKFVNKLRLWKYKGLAINETKINKTITKDSNLVGRNEPCPCGSGKKYKKCCGAGNKVIKL